MESLKVAYKALDDKFGVDITILDISQISVMADYFIIATGNNSSQVKAMVDAVGHELHKVGINLRHLEGYTAANWVLMDFGNIIVHVFDKENRSFYNLERIWGDAKIIQPTEL